MANPLNSIFNFLTDRERTTLENDRLREEIRAKRALSAAAEQQTSALGRLPGLLGPIPDEVGSANPITGERLSAPDVGNLIPAQAQRQSDLMGVLGQVAPAQLAQSVLPGQERAAPADIRTLAAMDEDPTFENIAELNRAQGAGRDSSGQILDSILKGLQIQQLQNEEVERLRGESDAKIAEKDGFRKGMSTIGRIALSNDQLSSTLLASGGAFRDQFASGARGLKLLGQITDNPELVREMQPLIDNFDTMKTDASILVREQLGTLDTNNITDSRQRLLEQGKASGDLSPAANRVVLQVLAEELMDDRRRKGIDIPGEELQLYEQMIRSFQTKNLNFWTEKEVRDAAAAGVLRDGDVVFLNGEELTVGVKE